MKAKQLHALGISFGKAMALALEACAEAAGSKREKKNLKLRLGAIVAKPQAWTEDPTFGRLALALIEGSKSTDAFAPRATPAPYRQWGDEIDGEAIRQMERACQVPAAVAGALMPDAHVGYGLPIGGVLATRGVVIPYAVGMDIACRMKMTVLDLPASTLRTGQDRLRRALERETRFGVGVGFQERRQHAVMDEDWSCSPVTESHRDKAWQQLGSSGSGNHFVEFGTLTLERAALGLEPGVYLALLSHSGSRGVGGAVASHYSNLARRLLPNLPKELAQLAWFDLDSHEGREYWLAMQLMGRYAAANHALIHRHVAANLGAEILYDLENHHNFAWIERHGGREVVVHRKGATPASAGALGIIPGSMATPGYVVRGLGHPASLDSAAHGAGRRLSRKAAKERFTWSDIKQFLDRRGVTLLAAGLDEAPMAYKDIDSVMRAQSDLVEPIARFDPKLVRMAPAGERPED